MWCRDSHAVTNLFHSQLSAAFSFLGGYSEASDIHEPIVAQHR